MSRHLCVSEERASCVPKLEQTGSHSLDFHFMLHGLFVIEFSESETSILPACNQHIRMLLWEAQSIYTDVQRKFPRQRIVLKNTVMNCKLTTDGFLNFFERSSVMCMRIYSSLSSSSKKLFFLLSISSVSILI